jgi:hypothetical protein
MNLCKSHTIAAALVFLAAGSIMAPAHAASDFKAISPAGCHPYGPNTTDSELTYNQLGITNPGVTNESVLCSITTDGDTFWSSTPGTSATLYMWFRAGSTAGRVACTVWASNATMTSGATYSTTVNPSNSAAYARSFSTFSLADISGFWGGGPPLVALCTLTPKATLGGFTFREDIVTNTP